MRASGKMAFEVKNIAKSFGEKSVLKNVSMTVARGDRVAIIGPNGVGKSTLVKILANKISQDCGEIVWSFKTKVGYFDQNYDILESEKKCGDDHLDLAVILKNEKKSAGKKSSHGKQAYLQKKEARKKTLKIERAMEKTLAQVENIEKKLESAKQVFAEPGFFEQNFPQEVRKHQIEQSYLEQEISSSYDNLEKLEKS